MGKNFKSMQDLFYAEIFCDVLFPVMTPVISFFRLINMERAVLVALHP